MTSLGVSYMRSLQLRRAMYISTDPAICPLERGCKCVHV
jgi:hypothetical protein